MDIEEEPPFQPTKCKAFLALLVVVAAVASVTIAAEHPDAPDSPALAPAEQADWCRIEGTDFAWAVQFCLLLMAVAILLWKRHREHPKRSLRVWLKDTSKQGVSSGAAHFCGMLNTLILGHLTHEADECGWYLASYCIDTSFGVYCAVTFLRILEREAPKRNWTSLIHTGVYPNVTVWAKQLIAFTLLVILARILCMIVLCALIYVLGYPVQLLCRIFDGNPHLFLVVVMLMGPGVLNMVQCWVQDNYLKRKDADAEYDELEADTAEDDTDRRRRSDSEDDFSA